jgi:hypothetical protein
VRMRLCACACVSCCRCWGRCSMVLWRMCVVLQVLSRSVVHQVLFRSVVLQVLKRIVSCCRCWGWCRKGWGWGWAGGRAFSAHHCSPTKLYFANPGQPRSLKISIYIKRYQNHPGGQKTLFTRDDIGKVQ